VKVILKQDWFGPNGHRYRRSPAGGFTIIPEEMRKALPKSARIRGREDAQEIREADTPEVPVEPELARDAELGRAGETEILARIERARARTKAPTA